jgi:hypothetical protein
MEEPAIQQLQELIHIWKKVIYMVINDCQLIVLEDSRRSDRKTEKFNLNEDWNMKNVCAKLVPTNFSSK